MKTIVFACYIISCAYLLDACKKNNTDLCDGECNVPKPLDTYKYPIKPGTPQWASFTTHQQMLDACQIPKDTLAKMSTKGILQSCIDFPLLGDLLLNVGVDVPGITQYYMITFSGLIELSRRMDAGTVMLEGYKIMDAKCARCNEPAFASNFNAFEMIIGHDSIQNKLSLSEKKILTKEAINKYKQKKSMPNYFALYGLSTSLYVCSKIMLSENYQPFIQVYNQNSDLQLFISKLLWPSNTDKLNNMFEQIADVAISFSN